MAEQDDRAGWKSSSRGEAAWKEARERIAARNTEARKEGKRAREAYEQERLAARRAAAEKRRPKATKPARPSS